MSSTLARMSTPVVIVFMVAYGASALVLFVCASVGFGQSLAVRIIEGIGGLLCLANAAGVPFADRVTVCSLLWFAAPIAALSEVLRIRRARKLHQEQLATT